MRSAITRAAAGAACVLAVTAVGLAPATQAAGPPTAAVAEPDSPDRQAAPVIDASGEGTGLWIVRLTDAPLASYTGDLPGLAATTTGGQAGPRRLDVAAPSSVAYLDHLADVHERFVVDVEALLGRDVEVAHTYRNVVNGLAVRVDDEEAAALAELPGVAAVYEDVAHEPQTDASHDLIRSAEVWAGATGTGVGTRGEGVVVGMIDTGVNPDHPSFAATDAEGYTHTNPLGAGTYLGVCDPDHPRHDDICNDKLIGAWTFYPGEPTARDLFGHGSHVGSTIAGNVHEATFTVGADRITRTVQGVAPRANVISYHVCLPTCPESSTVAAVDQAIADPTQVLNYSIEGVDNPWGDVVSQAFLDAANAGIFVAASAGNSGPQEGTVAHTAPWVTSVAAANHGRAIGHRMDVTGPAPVPPQAEGIAAVPGTGPAIAEDLTGELRAAGDACAPYEDAVLTGAIALIDETSCPYRIKVANAAAAGAIGVVVWTEESGPPTQMGQLERTSIPAVMVDRAAGTALHDVLAGPGPVTVQVAASAEVFADDGWAGTVAWFSSRGPSRFELLGPTLAAPGVGVLAAGSPVAGDPNQYLMASGTSMASPHVAGAAALLAALHPQWSPAQVRSALAGTTTPLDAGVFDAGAGLVDVAGASRVGLVLDETYADFVAADPSSGGDPQQLNLPSFVEHGCAASCSWTRTVTNVADTEAAFVATSDAPAGVSVIVSPSEFTLDSGAQQSIRVTVDLDPGAYAPGDWVAAAVGFTTDAIHSSGQPVAPVRYPIAVEAAEPDRITLTAEAYRSRGDVRAELTWSGATSDQVDIHRDGELLATVDNHGRYVDDLGRPPRGTAHTYRVCRIGSREVCSPEAVIELDPLIPPAPRPRITTSELPDLNVLEGYRHTLLATGGSGSYLWSATGLPEGLILDETTGVLRHDPDAPAAAAGADTTGPAQITVSVRDAEWPGPGSTATLELDVIGVAEIAAGWGHTCALTTDEAAYCWGRDATGQVGRGVVGGDGVHVPTPVPVLDGTGDAPLTGVTQIAGGDGHTCALTTEGTVSCWGAAFDGRLGDGDPTPQPKPLPVTVLNSDGDEPLDDVVQIAVGWQFGCAITGDERLYCWGNNGSGKLGIGTTGGIQPLPVAVLNSDGTGPLTGVTAIGAGASHACAVAEGTPYCWGANFQGQLGTGETGVGTPLPSPVAGDLSDVVQLDADAGHTCAVTATGSASCWGGNASGQLGRGDSGADQPVPAEVRDPAGTGPLADVTAIAVGANHTCALAGAGDAYCWGFNGSGQVGHGVIDGSNPSLPVRVLDPSGSAPFAVSTSLSAGSAHTCAVTATSGSFCWGGNFNWQLGIGPTIEGHVSPLPVPTRPGPGGP